MSSCIYCNEFGSLIKYGSRYTKERGKIQRFCCKDCKRIFVVDDGFKNKHKSKETIVKSILLTTKLSLREVEEFMPVCKNTVLEWLKQYSHLLHTFLKDRIPNMCDVLHMDELFLKMKGKFYYVWDSICKDTRFIFWFLSKRRNGKSAERLIRMSPVPLDKLVTDGSFAYMQPVKNVYGIRWYHTKYHRCESFEDKKNNNLIERVQNTLRRYIHFKRGFNSERTGNI